MEEKLQESELDLEMKLRKKMHSLINKIALHSGTDKRVEKNKLRMMLIRDGHIKKSTTELGIKKLAVICNFLEETTKDY